MEDIMGKISVETCEIEGLKVITPEVRGDERGYFMETYQYNDFKAAGIDEVFVQDNQSASKKGVLRGLHFQIRYPQAKLVRVIKGEVFDVAVDLRKGSATFGKWHGVLLSEENKKQFIRRRHGQPEPPCPPVFPHKSSRSMRKKTIQNIPCV